MATGKNFDMKLAGAYAVDSLRLEKGYRHWGHELDTETTPLEAGLGFAVDMSKVNNTSSYCLLLSVGKISVPVSQ